MIAKVAILVCALGVLSASPSSAQDYTGDLGVVYTDIGIQTAMMDSAMEAVVEPERNATQSTSVQQPQSLTFRSTSERRRVNFRSFIEKTREVDPEGAVRLQELLASTDLIKEVGAVIVPYGLSTNNLADAFTVWWMNAWDGANGVNREYTRAQVTAVKAQAADALLATSELVGASDAQKQELAEAYLIQAALIQAYVEAAAHDPALMANVRTAIRQGANASGMDLDAIVLTPQGFRPRQGAALDPAATGEADPQLAAAAAVQEAGAGEENTLPTYAAIAAAAGAGLAGAYWLGRGGQG